MIALFRRLFRLDDLALDALDTEEEDHDLRSALTESALARDLAQRRIETRRTTMTWLEDALTPRHEGDYHP